MPSARVASTAATLAPSHVLEAMGVLTHGNVRLSLQRDATRAQVDAFCDALPDVVRELRRELEGLGSFEEGLEARRAAVARRPAGRRC